MNRFDKKIQSVRNICKQLEELENTLSKLHDVSLIREYQEERNKQLARLKQLLSQQAEN